MRAPLSIGSVLLVLVVACSGEADFGEACDVPGGGPGVCEDGTVCGKPSDKSGALLCIPTCIDDKDCPGGHDCKGVEGTSAKGCRYKD